MTDVVMEPGHETHFRHGNGNWNVVPTSIGVGMGI